MRQIDALASQQHYQKQKQTIPIIEQIKFIVENEENVLNNIRSFGRFNLDNCNFTNNIFIMEDYICPSADHELMYKCLNGKDNDGFDSDASNDGSIVVDFSNNQAIIKDNANYLNDSIVNITLNESRELIENVKLGYDEHVIDPTDSLSSSPQVIEIIERNIGSAHTAASADANGNVNEISETTKRIAGNVNGDCKAGKQQKIKIHGCNGAINLKNISNLTINTNCCNDKHASLTTNNMQTEEAVQSGEVIDSANTPPLTYNCEFYRRLMDEIKSSFLRHDELMQRKQTDHLMKSVVNNNSVQTADEPTTTTPTSTTTNTTTTAANKSSKGGNPAYNKILFKNIKNLKINIPIRRKNLNGVKNKSKVEADGNASDNTHPVQIEQWLKQIILETEIEPTQNNEFLEHSHIHSP